MFGDEGRVYISRLGEVYENFSEGRSYFDLPLSPPLILPERPNRAPLHPKRSSVFGRNMLLAPPRLVRRTTDQNLTRKGHQHSPKLNRKHKRRQGRKKLKKPSPLKVSSSSFSRVITPYKEMRRAARRSSPRALRRALRTYRCLRAWGVLRLPAPVAAPAPLP